MNNILKVALIGGGAYLAYNFLKSRNKNNVIIASTTTPVDSPVIVEEALMEEEGSNFSNATSSKDAHGCESSQKWCNVKGACLPKTSWYSLCVSNSGGVKAVSAGVSKKASLATKSFSRADGWDSDVISNGINDQ